MASRRTTQLPRSAVQGLDGIAEEPVAHCYAPRVLWETTSHAVKRNAVDEPDISNDEVMGWACVQEQESSDMKILLLLYQMAGISNQLLLQIVRGAKTCFYEGSQSSLVPEKLAIRLGLELWPSNYSWNRWHRCQYLQTCSSEIPRVTYWWIASHYRDAHLIWDSRTVSSRQCHGKVLDSLDKR